MSPPRIAVICLLSGIAQPRRAVESIDARARHPDIRHRRPTYGRAEPGHRGREARRLTCVTRPLAGSDLVIRSWRHRRRAMSVVAVQESRSNAGFDEHVERVSIEWTAI